MCPSGGVLPRTAHTQNPIIKHSLNLISKQVLSGLNTQDKQPSSTF